MVWLTGGRPALAALRGWGGAGFPLGAPPLPGPMMRQKNEWLLWPPALLRTPVRIASGTFERSAIKALTGRDARAGRSLRKLLAFVMYA